MSRIISQGLLFVALIFILGCENTSLKEYNENSAHEKKVEQKAVKIPTHAAKKETKHSILLDTKERYAILIFSANSKYDKQLKEEMKKSEKLRTTLDNFTLHFIDVLKDALYSIKHNGEEITTSTSLLLDIYGVKGTPTMVFKDKKDKSIFIVPGYMPPKQFLATLEFIKSKQFVGINRKNGDIYKKLKSFYESKGIEVKKSTK